MNSIEWISVEDRLPTVDGEYLVYSAPWRDFEVNLFRTATKTWFSRYELSVARYVTHWAIFPMPPEESKCF